jgi:hypothetical protein
MSALSALETTERDTLGLYATTPQSLHVDVLDASERALAQALLAAGAAAEAPRAPTGGRGGLVGRYGAVPTPAALEAARANVESLARGADDAQRDAADAAAAWALAVCRAPPRRAAHRGAGR